MTLGSRCPLASCLLMDVWLFFHPVSCLVWGIPVLELTSCWMGPGFSAKDPKCLPLAGGHIVPHYVCHQGLLPQSLSCPFPSQESQQGQQVGLARLLWSHCFCSVTQCPQGLCVQPPRAESLFSPVCEIPAVKPCQPSKPEVLGTPPLDARPLGWGPGMGLRTLTPIG